MGLASQAPRRRELPESTGYIVGAAVFALVATVILLMMKMSKLNGYVVCTYNTVIGM